MPIANDLLDLSREGLLLALALSLPVLGAALAASLITGLLQGVARISEPALTQIPRMAAVMLTLLATAPWVGRRVADFAERLWSLLQAVAR